MTEPVSKRIPNSNRVRHKLKTANKRVAPIREKTDTTTTTTTTQYSTAYIVSRTQYASTGRTLLHLYITTNRLSSCPALLYLLATGIIH